MKIRKSPSRTVCVLAFVALTLAMAQPLQANITVTGTITLTNGELEVSNSVNINGPGAANLTVSGYNTNRVFSVTANNTVNIVGLTIANGKPNSDGGGIKNSNAMLTVTGCTISNCSASVGGGIRNYFGTVTLNNCILTGNYGSIGAKSGGAIYNDRGTVTLLDTTLSGNAGDVGGAIWNYVAPSVMVIRNCLISSNVAINGGGIRNEGALSITNSTFNGNRADVGGALHNYYTSNASSPTTADIYGSTFAFNYATNVGGGVATGSASPKPQPTTRIYNCILSGNTCPFGPDLFGFINSLDFNLVQNTNGCTITGSTTHNIYGQDPKLASLADNGGPTMTHALLPGSPAIDHGSSGGLTTDQRGQPRPIRFPAYLAPGDGSDIGAYELQERAQTNWVVNGSSSNLLYIVNSTNDVDDGVPGIAHCSLREAINAANANADSNSIIFAASIPGVMNGVMGTIVLTNGELSLGGWAGYDLSISGPGASKLSISGNNVSRVFSKNYSTATISGLTIADGNTGLGNGGGAGIFNYGGTMLLSDCVVSNCVSGEGGGVYNSDKNASAGFLTLLRCTITKNASYNGGGVGNSAHLYMSDSTICSNISYRYGGGLFNGWSAWLTNCTISGNTLAGEAVAGGGIYGDYSHVNGGSDLLLVSCTVAFNGDTNSQTAGGIFSANPLSPVRLRNTLIAGNSAIASPDCAGPFDSLEYNLVGNTNGATITGTNTHDIYNQDPLLSPLVYLGGPTPTHALRYDSPALNAGNSGGLTTDQRGFPRPLGTAAVSGGDGSDIGAYEADPNLRLTAIAMAGNDILLNFTTVFGRNYEIDSANNLNGSWTMVTNNVAGSGGVMQAVDAGGASKPQRFYRAAQLP